MPGRGLQGGVGQPFEQKGLSSFQQGREDMHGLIIGLQNLSPPAIMTPEVNYSLAESRTSSFFIDIFKLRICLILESHDLLKSPVFTLLTLLEIL